MERRNTTVEELWHRRALLFFGIVAVAAGCTKGDPRNIQVSRQVLAAEPFADWVGVIGTGQSLSVGAAAGTPISTTQPFNNLKLLDQGPDPRNHLDGGGDLSLVALTERVRPPLPVWSDIQYPNQLAGESSNAEMANDMFQL